MQEIYIENDLRLAVISTVWNNILDTINKYQSDIITFNLGKVENFDDSGLQCIVFLMRLAYEHPDKYRITEINSELEKTLIDNGFEYRKAVSGEES